MDQGHSRIPYLGTQCQFANPLRHHIQGVLIHGFGMFIDYTLCEYSILLLGLKLFQTFGNILKGACLTIHCFLLSFFYWYAHTNRFPDEIYLQVDGGSENANKYLLALCELFVIKRFCKVFLYTRLPTGHTHEDIDAAFGHIWSNNRHRPVETVKDYASCINQAFKSTKLKAEVEAIYVMPDYIKYLSPCIDPFFGNYSKEIDTQHQWKFTAVERSLNFPLGGKTQYRAYSSDKVVEMQFKRESECLTPIGKLTGIEPVTTHVKWFPDETTFPERKVEGYYLLNQIPGKKYRECQGNPKNLFEPQEFAERSSIEFEQTMLEVRNRWKNSNPIRIEWENWYSNICPKSQMAREYAETHESLYQFPLSEYLYSNTEVEPSWVTDLIQPEEEKGLDWPEVIAYTTPSVSSGWNRNPGPSRIYTSLDVKLNDDVKEYNRVTEHYYSDYLNTKTVEVLKDMIRIHKIESQSKFHSGRNKKELIKQIKDYDINFIKYYLKSLLAENLIYLQNVLHPYQNRDPVSEVVTKIEFESRMYELRLNIFRGVKPETQFSHQLLDYIMILFNKREANVKKWFDEKNQPSDDAPDPDENQIIPYFPNYFASSNFHSMLARSHQHNENDLFMKLSRFFVPIKTQDELWIAFVIYPQLKKIFYLDLMVRNPDILYHNEILAYKNKLNQWISFILEEDTHFELLLFPQVNLVFNPIQNLFNTGIALVTAFEYLIHDIPIFMKEEDMNSMRSNLGYRILLSEKFDLSY